MPLGPVQLMVIAFDHPTFNGEAAAEINRLSEAGIIRLLDAIVVNKDDDGTVTTVEVTELDADEMIDMGATIGALIGLGAAGEAGAELGAILGAEAAADGHVLDSPEIVDVLDEIPDGSAAAVVLLEHVWAIPLSNAIEGAGGTPIIDMWVHPLELVALGDALASE